MRTLLLILNLILFISPGFGQPSKSPLEYVDVFMGTSNSRWMLGPYATMPFGMIQLGPDNQGDQWMGGYEYAINSVSGFSHIHAWTMAGLRMMPTTADLVLEDRPVDAPYKGANAGYHSRILKESEKGSPGYYEVYLYDHDVKAEMTVTTRCGFQKYTFPRKKESRVLVDLLLPSEYGLQINDARITKVSNTEIEGYADCSSAGWNNYKLHFVLQFSKPFKNMNGWNQGKEQDGIKEISGKDDIGVYVVYETEKDEEILVKSGISMVSIDQARLNLNTEINTPFGWDFNAVKENAKTQWEHILNRIKVSGSNEVDKVKFYTNLYRVYAAKQTWNDVNGLYMDPCEHVQQSPDGVAMYGGDAFWNSFWNINGLLSLITPDISKNWVLTQLELFEKTGWTGKGPTGLEYSGIMEGSHEMALMLSAYQKGIYTEDPDKLYQAMKKNVTVSGGRYECGGYVGNPGLDHYINHGYMPSDKGVTNKTLDYAFDDWCVAQMARAIGNKKDYRSFMKRSENYKNAFHPTLKFMVPKDSKGNWKEDFNPFDNYNFIEGNSWQYTLYVPHDIPGVVELVGKDLFNTRLEEGFEKSKEHKYAAHALDRTGGRKSEYYINHGNQVNMQAAWLFNYSGKPWLTQKYTRDIMETYYGSTPYHGWEGDEDEGQMGAWFVMSSLGLFEMNGGGDKEPILDLSSPLFDKMVVQLDSNYYSGKEFVIEVRNNSKENLYIQSAQFNGKPLESCQLKFKDVVGGGTLELHMGKNPNKSWGKL
ncbi:GH92 family glycosyl hydrolase [Zhouia amylolytica]|uniref:GH92 family glycosyl hydrolase n=1 Tax=Zhouia amylolytica TaxID=376730 RepID=UPI0020CE9944|nr:GH92 family glycosyl hydrolase [Zhouia amylolytica]MCQ0112619.1 GH92 family glycosyl hydrolase [Zhouia amylolytica]